MVQVMTEYKNTPEQRLKVAQLLLLHPYIQDKKVLLKAENKYYTHGDNEFDPFNNAEQLVELVKYFKLRILPDVLFHGSWTVHSTDGNIVDTGEELEQAIMQVVWQIAEEGDG